MESSGCGDSPQRGRGSLSLPPVERRKGGLRSGRPGGGPSAAAPAATPAGPGAASAASALAFPSFSNPSEAARDCDVAVAVHLAAKRRFNAQNGSESRGGGIDAGCGSSPSNQQVNGGSIRLGSTISPSADSIQAPSLAREEALLHENLALRAQLAGLKGKAVGSGAGKASAPDAGRVFVDMPLRRVGASRSKSRGGGGPAGKGPAVGRGRSASRRTIGKEAAAGAHKSSWAAVVAASAPKRSMVLHYEPPTLVDGGVVVEAGDDFLHAPHPLWSECLVGYFIGRKLPFPMVDSIARRLWAKDGLLETISGEHGFFFFRFANEDARRRILDVGNWIFGGQPIFLRQWVPTTTLSRESHASLPLWVKFFNVPLALWCNDGLSKIASAVGKPLYADNMTEDLRRTTFARICVEVNAKLDLPERFSLKFNGELVPIVCDYQWKPPRCPRCCVFGHICRSGDGAEDATEPILSGDADGFVNQRRPKGPRGDRRDADAKRRGVAAAIDRRGAAGADAVERRKAADAAVVRRVGRDPSRAAGSRTGAGRSSSRAAFSADARRNGTGSSSRAAVGALVGVEPGADADPDVLLQPGAAAESEAVAAGCSVPGEGLENLVLEVQLLGDADPVSSVFGSVDGLSPIADERGPLGLREDSADRRSKAGELSLVPNLTVVCGVETSQPEPTPPTLGNQTKDGAEGSVVVARKTKRKKKGTDGLTEGKGAGGLAKE